MNKYIMNVFLTFIYIGCVYAGGNYSGVSDVDLEELYKTTCNEFTKNEYGYIRACLKHSKCYLYNTGCPISHNRELEVCDIITNDLFEFSDKLHDSNDTLRAICGELRRRGLAFKKCNQDIQKACIKLYRQDQQLQEKGTLELLKRQQEMHYKKYDGIGNANVPCDHCNTSCSCRDEMKIYNDQVTYYRKLKLLAIEEELRNRGFITQE